MIHYNDDELLYLYRCGSEEAQMCLFENYYFLISYWMKSFSNYSHLGLDYDDFVQVGLLTFWYALLNYRTDKDTTLYSYVRSSVFKKATSLASLRKDQRFFIENTIFSLDDFMDVEEHRYEEVIGDPSITYQPEKKLMIRDQTESILQYMRNKGTYIEKRVLYYSLKGFTIDEIADILHITVKAVYNSLYRARQKIIIDSHK